MPPYRSLPGHGPPPICSSFSPARGRWPCLRFPRRSAWGVRCTTTSGEKGPHIWLDRCRRQESDLLGQRDSGRATGPSPDRHRKVIPEFLGIPEHEETYI